MSTRSAQPGSTPHDPARLEVVELAFDRAPHGMLIASAEGGILTVNAAFCRLSGRRAEDMAGKAVRLLAADPPGDEIFTRIAASIDRSAPFQGKVLRMREPGQVLPAWLSIAPLQDESGTVTHFAASLMDLGGLEDAQRAALLGTQHDPVTGLASRTLLHDRLAQTVAAARTSGEQFAVLLLDLDRFKSINESLGHEVGDQVLRRAAKRLAACLREDDALARLGGDEFVLVLRNIRDARAPVAVAKKVSQELYRSFLIKGSEFNLTSSIGISLYPQDGVDAASLLEHAEIAMNRAKERGSNSYSFYRAQMADRIKERLLLEQSLHRALERGELELFYQAQTELASGRVTGAEALLRWQHPEMGLLAPDRFIQVAEETGLIRPIGEWVLRTVCAQMRSWSEEGLGPLRMAINLSGQQILRSKHTDALRAALAEFWQPAEGLELEIEITESTLQTSENVLASANLLKSMDVTLAIDDFGTGYSSLMALKLLPIDRLKIDRSFVDGTPHNADHSAVASAVIAMGKALGLRVLAEGVETLEQLEFLRAQGCDEAQGYLFSKPLPADEFRSYLREARGSGR